MSLKKIILLYGALLLVPIWALAQEEDKKGAGNGRVLHDLTFHMGSLDMEENAEHLTAILSTHLDASIEVEAIEYDLPEEAFRIVETMHLNKNFAVEGALAHYGSAKVYFIQEATSEAPEGTRHRVDVRLSGFELSAMGKLPIKGEKLVAYGKAGAGYSRTEYTLDANDTEGNYANQDEDGVALTFGAGLYSLIRNKYVLRLDYVSGKADSMDISSLSLGLGFRF